MGEMSHWRTVISMNHYIKKIWFFYSSVSSELNNRYLVLTWREKKKKKYFCSRERSWFKMNMNLSLFNLWICSRKCARSCSNNDGKKQGKKFHDRFYYSANTGEVITCSHLPTVSSQSLILLWAVKYLLPHSMWSSYSMCRHPGMMHWAARSCLWSSALWKVE